MLTINTLAHKLLSRPFNPSLSNFLSRSLYVRRKQAVAYDPSLNPKQYYDELLNATVVDEDGCYSIGPTHLSNMIDLIKNEEDLDTVIEAYYNFKGHKTIFSNKIVDKLVNSSIEISKPEKVFDILNFHHYLLYYPHTRTINLLLDSILSTQNHEA